MGERVQPGGRVDKETYEQFKKFVQNHHGKVRGSLGDELEIAMKERMNSVNKSDQLTRIENDVAHLKAIVADAETNGGTGSIDPTAPDLPDADVRPRADSADRADDVDDGRPDFVADAPDEPPHYNQPRGEKAAWLARHVDQERATSAPDGSGAIGRPAMKHIIDEQYGFEDDTIDAIVAKAIDILNAEPDPTDDAGHRVAWGDTLRERNEQFEQEQRDENDDVWSDMDDAERGRR